MKQCLLALAAVALASGCRTAGPGLISAHSQTTSGGVAGLIGLDSATVKGSEGVRVSSADQVASAACKAASSSADSAVEDNVGCF
ncbi:MAG: hypothetical protein VKN33_07530 [Candidatus Sericytochromatia bacterium]|nr:hypothetical protein [Candidatus Sericytochromatia bacterium]